MLPVAPDSVILPQTFEGKKDTMNIGSLLIKDFFADTNLTHLIYSGIKNNIDLKIASLKIQFAAADVSIAKSRFFPIVAPEVSTRIDKFGKYTMNGVGNYDTNLSENVDETLKIPNPTPDIFIGIRTAWEVGMWGRLRNMRKSAVSRFLASEKGQHLIITNLVAQIAILYYDLLALDNELLTIRNNIELQEKAVEIISAMKEGGRSNELALKQFQAQLLETKSMEIDLSQQIIISENKMNFLLARFPQAIVRGKPIREQVFPSEIQSGVPSLLLLQRPDIRQAELELIAAKADLKVARAAFLPTFNISAYGGFNAFKSSLLFTSPQSLALGALASITSPLWNQNLIKSNFRKSSNQQLAAFYNYQKSIINGYQEVIISLNGIRNYKQIYELKEMETEALYSAVAASKDLFMAGKASYLEVITAQKKVLQAELEWSVARKNQFIALIDLYKALGGGWK